MATQQQSPFHRTVGNSSPNNASALNTGQVSPRAAEANSIKDYIAKLKVRTKHINYLYFLLLLTLKLILDFDQGQLTDAYSELKEYKKLSELYRGEIEQMRHVLEAVNQDNMSHLVPKLQLISDTYNHAISSQKKENELMQ